MSVPGTYVRSGTYVRARDPCPCPCPCVRPCVCLCVRYSDEIRRLIQQQAGQTEPGGADLTDAEGADDLAAELSGNFTDLGLPDGADDNVGSVGIEGDSVGSVGSGGFCRVGVLEEILSGR